MDLFVDEEENQLLNYINDFNNLSFMSIKYSRGVLYYQDKFKNKFKKISYFKGEIAVSFKKIH